MEYSILKYKAKCNLPELERKKVEKPSRWNTIGRLDSEYYHEEFGAYTDEDGENALAHVIGAIDDLILNPNENESQERLERDIRNYLECIHSRRERANAYHLLSIASDLLSTANVKTIIQEYIQRMEL